MLYAYCIRKTGESGPPPDLRGVDSFPVDLLEGASLGIWVSQGEVGAPTPDRLREHERVVRYALRSSTPLPMRFGTRFSGAAEALAALEARKDEFLASLARVEGRVEMGIRVSTSAASQPPLTDEAAELPASGRAYLEARKRTLLEDEIRKAGAGALLQQVQKDLASFGGEVMVTPAAEAEFVGSLAHLLHRGQVRPFRERVTGLQEERRDLVLSVSGPWAPYSFMR